MIGLLQLTAPDNSPVYVNPTFIGFFTKPSPGLAHSMGVEWEHMHQQGTLAFVSGTRLSFKENPNEIINAITRLRVKSEKNTLDLIKKRDKEDWESDTECEDD